MNHEHTDYQPAAECELCGSNDHTVQYLIDPESYSAPYEVWRHFCAPCYNNAYAEFTIPWRDLTDRRDRRALSTHNGTFIYTTG